MKRAPEPKLSEGEILSLELQDLLMCIDKVAPEERARCAESVACDFIAIMQRYHPDGWDTVLELIGTEPSASECGLLTAAALATTGPRRVDLARRAATMRRSLPKQDWLDHIGAAAPTGRAARVDSYPGRLMWLIELDDGLHRYCLMTQQDLDRGILEWAGLFEPIDEIEPSPDGVPPLIPTEVPLHVAVAGMRESLTVPGMWGVSTTVHMFGPFVRWRLWQLDLPELTGLEQVDWQPPVLRPVEPHLRPLTTSSADFYRG